MAQTWDTEFKLKPDGDDAPSSLDNQQRAHRAAVEERMENEHDTVSDDTAGLASRDWRHKKGSARAYYETPAPTKQPGSEGASLDDLTGLDDGRLWIDSDTDVMSVWDGDEFTPVNSNPAGVILFYGGATAPTGYFLCNGASKSKTTYPGLFTAIGYTFGGSADNMILPDLRGIFIRGAGSNGSMTDALGDVYAGGSVGDEVSDSLQGHKHSISDTKDLATFNGIDVRGDYNGSPAFLNIVTPVVGAATTDETYGTLRVDAETKPASVALNYIIKY